MTSLGLFENDVELYDPASVSIKGENAPSLSTYRFIPRDGSPNRLLERWEPQYALERLFPDDADGEKAWQELKTLLGARIDEGLAGKVSGKRIGEVLDEELANGGRQR